MAKQHSVDQEMDLIMSNPPSIIRNSSFVFLVRVVTFLVGLSAFIIGVSFLISTTMQTKLVDLILVDPVFNENAPINSQIERITFLCGIGSICLGILLLFISRLSKMILKRNGFVVNAMARWEELR